MISLRTLLRMLPILLICSLASATPPQPYITVLDPGLPGGGLPYTIHVHVLATATNPNPEPSEVLGAGDWLTAKYEWDFGDPDGDYNVLPGWNAAHTYDRAGEFPITVTVTNELGEIGTDSTTIVIGDDGRQTLYVSNSGNDAWPGTEAQPIASFRGYNSVIDRLNSNPGISYHVYFARGDVWEIDSNADLNISASDWVFDAYTDDPEEQDLPAIRRTGGFDPEGGSKLLALDNGSGYHDVVIQNMQFDSTHGDPEIAYVCSGVHLGAYENVTIRRCVFDNIREAIVADSASPFPKGVFSYENTSRNLRAYHAYITGDDHVHIHNTARDSSHEHNIRIDAGYEVTKRALIAFNDLTNDIKTTIWFRRASFGYITGNTCREGRVRLGPDPQVDLVENPLAVNHRTYWCVFERNMIDRSLTSDGFSSLQVQHGANDTMIRNNIIRSTSFDEINVDPWDSDFNRAVEHLYIYHNTGIHDYSSPTTQGKGRAFLYVQPPDTNATTVEDINLNGNLSLAPNFEQDSCCKRGVVFVLDDAESLGSFTTIADNAWPTPPAMPEPFFVGLWSNEPDPYRNLTEWLTYAEVSDDAQHVLIPADLDARYRPPEGSVPDDHCGAVLGVWEDYYGQPRSAGGGWAAGAVEINNCPEDLASPVGVEMQDLNAVLNRWGDPDCLSAPPFCPEDLVYPVGVEMQDLNAVLNRWGDPDCEPGDGFAGGGGGESEGGSGGIPNLLSEFGITDAAWTASLAMLGSEDEAVRNCWWCWFLHYMLPAPGGAETGCGCDNPFVVH